MCDWTSTVSIQTIFNLVGLMMMMTMMSSVLLIFRYISYISDSFRIYMWYKNNTSCSWWRHINTRIMWSVFYKVLKNVILDIPNVMWFTNDWMPFKLHSICILISQVHVLHSSITVGTLAEVLKMTGSLKCDFEGNQNVCFNQSERDNFDWTIKRVV